MRYWFGDAQVLGVEGCRGIASCPTCGFQLTTARTQQRVERRAAGRICPICQAQTAK